MTAVLESRVLVERMRMALSDTGLDPTLIEPVSEPGWYGITGWLQAISEETRRMLWRAEAVANGFLPHEGMLCWGCQREVVLVGEPHRACLAQVPLTENYGAQR